MLSEQSLSQTTTSTPTLSSFDPTIIPYQYQVIRDVRKKYDYSLGVHEVMLSGSVGSAKSILLAHLAVTHCLLYPGAVVCLGRRSMPDLKDTIFNKILEHIADLEEGKDYTWCSTRATVEFANLSKIISRSWMDKRYEKARSLELSMFVIEEITENDSAVFQAFYKEYRARVGRLPHIPENLVIGATNPAEPSHAAYDYFIAKGNNYRRNEVRQGDIPTRHVYYSVTTDNPFLPSWYIEQLKETYTERECRRMIFGEWLELNTEVIYYAFEEELSVIDNYTVNPDFPIIITYDFNIGKGKPMSCAFRQRIDGVFYYFAEIVLEGSRTEDTLDEAFSRGLLHYDTQYIVRGDATGAARTTKSKHTDYSIISDFLANCPNRYGGTGLDYKIDVPFSNPPIRTRHIKVNGQLKNAKGKTHVKIVKNDCKTLIKGLKLTKLKESGQYIEDDSAEYQHITTAIGYDIVQELKNEGAKQAIIRKL